MFVHITTVDGARHRAFIPAAIGTSYEDVVREAWQATRSAETFASLLYADEAQALPFYLNAAHIVSIKPFTAA